MKRVAILGANGRLGNEVLHAFYAAGYQVTGVTRNGRVRKAPTDIRQVAADAMNLQQLKKAVRGADFIFNGLRSPYTALVRTALSMARNVIAAARSTHAVHLVPGNLYGYGKHIPLLCEPNTPLQADGIQGRISIEMEKLFATAAQKYKVQTLLIRAGDFYGGSGTGSWFDLALMDKLEQDRFVYPGPLDVAHAWAYLPDLAQTFVAVAEQHQHCQLFERVLYPGHNLTGAELQELVEQAHGRDLTLLNMPWKLIRMGRFLVPVWRELAEVAYLWSRPHALSGERLVQLVGEPEQTPPAVAVRKTLRELPLKS